MKNNKILTRDDLVKLDKELKMVTLTLDAMFKSIFTYDLDILKEFLILITGLDLDPNKTTITLLNNELPKENKKEYKKTIDIYVNLNEKININCELNDSSFNSKLAFRNEAYVSMMIESGESLDEAMEKQLIQLNLNTKNTSINYGEDILMTYGVKTGKVYTKNRQTILKYLAYYKKMYYTFGVNLNKADRWLIVILSKNFTELYDLLETLLTNEKRDKFIRKVIDMSKDKFILSEWEKEKMDKLKELARLEDAQNEGHEKGFEQGIEKGIEKGIEQGIKEGIEQGIKEGIKEGKIETNFEIAKKMLEKNIAKEIISECTTLSIEEINNLLNQEN